MVISSVLQAVSALILAFAPSVGAAMVAAGLLGAPLVVWLGGFEGLFVLAAVACLLGAVAVMRVRSVR